MRCLVIVICQTRGHRTTWPSFKQNVLDSLGADLALCVETSDTPDPFRAHAKYIWESPDYIDWADAYTDVSRELGSTVDWRPILSVGRSSGCLFGGIQSSAPAARHGSGAVLFYYRWRVHEAIRRLNLTEQYDWFILTRSDYMYTVPHVPVDMLDPTSVWSPDGERYGGITDRHLICPARYILEATSMLQCMLTTPDEFVRIFQASPSSETNPETCIAAYFAAKSIPVRFVPYFMYVVRELDEVRNPTYIESPPDHVSYKPYSPLTIEFQSTVAVLPMRATRKHIGTCPPYAIKYPAEKESADKLQLRTKEEWVRYIDRPSAI